MKSKPNNRGFRLLKSVALPQLTCFQCHPHPQPQFLVAAGTHHGRVHLVNFKVPPKCLGFMWEEVGGMLSVVLVGADVMLC